MKSEISRVCMDWDDINSIIQDLKEVMDDMDERSPDYNEFNVSIARAIAALRSEKTSSDKSTPLSVFEGTASLTRAKHMKTIADSRLREELKSIFDW